MSWKRQKISKSIFGQIAHYSLMIDYQSNGGVFYLRFMVWNPLTWIITILALLIFGISGFKEDFKDNYDWRFRNQNKVKTK